MALLYQVSMNILVKRHAAQQGGSTGPDAPEYLLYTYPEDTWTMDEPV